MTRIQEFTHNRHKRKQHICKVLKGKEKRFYWDGLNCL